MTNWSHRSLANLCFQEIKKKTIFVKLLRSANIDFFCKLVRKIDRNLVFSINEIIDMNAKSIFTRRMQASWLWDRWKGESKHLHAYGRFNFIAWFFTISHFFAKLLYMIRYFFYSLGMICLKIRKNSYYSHIYLYILFIDMHLKHRAFNSIIVSNLILCFKEKYISNLLLSIKS